MLLVKDKEKVDYLIQVKKKFLKEDTLNDFKSEKKRTKEFVDSFNKESRNQKSSWYAETEEHISICDGKPFILTYISKKLLSGWWIFKDIKIIKLHICVYENHTSFVDNDYVFSDYEKEKNSVVFKYLPEVEPILEKIPQVFFILPKEELYNFDKEIAKIEREICELKKNGRNKKPTQDY